MVCVYLLKNYSCDCCDFAQKHLFIKVLYLSIAWISHRYVFYIKVLFLVCVMNFYSLNFSCMYCSCCAKDTNGFLIDFVTNKYEPTYFPKEQIKQCELCFDEINNSCHVMVVCVPQKKQVLCLDCFFRGFCSVDDFVNFDMPFYKCPFGNCRLSIISLKQLFLYSGVFKAIKDKRLEIIKSLLEKKTGVVEVHNESLEACKKLFQNLNVNTSVSNLEYKPCPFCHIPAEKVLEGRQKACNTTICAKCECVFCWLCGWCTFGLANGGHEHYWAGDCVEKGNSDLMYDFFDIATYYGREYLFGQAAYQKPRFFMSGETRKNVYFVQHKKQFNEENYKIEYEICEYDTSGNKVKTLSVGECL